MTRRLKKWQWWTIAGVGAAFVAVVVFVLIYIFSDHSEQEAAKDFDELVENVTSSTVPGAPTTVVVTTAAPGSTAPDTTAPAATNAPTSAPGEGTGLAGTWATITPTEDERENFYVGYRVNEILFSRDVTATGRTRDVTGTLTFDETGLTAAEFTAQMATVESDESRRDNQFRGRIMAVDQFPTASFVLTQPIAIASAPAEGEVLTFTATGDFTAHGTTNSVTFELRAFQAGGRITVTGEIPIVFADYGIPSPSFGPATVEDNGSMEFLLSFERAA